MCVSPQVNLQSSSNNETYQERLARLEGDKESLVLQVRYFTKASKAFQLSIIVTMSTQWEDN